MNFFTNFHINYAQEVKDARNEVKEVRKRVEQNKIKLKSYNDKKNY